jgi:hypothetical protein
MIAYNYTGKILLVLFVGMAHFLGISSLYDTNNSRHNSGVSAFKYVFRCFKECEGR